MEIKALKCPSCGGSISIPPGAVASYCPYCGTALQISYDTPKDADAPAGMTSIQDARSGMMIGQAVIPEGWNVQGSYMQVKIDEITPIGTAMQAISPDGSMAIGMNHGEHFYDFTYNGPLQLAAPRSQWKDFLDPQDYLRALAEQITKSSVSVTSVGTLETAFNRNRAREAEKLVSRFEENAHIVLPNVQCDLRLQDILCESQIIVGTYTNTGQPWVILMGADLFGLEYYDAAPMGTANRAMSSGLRKLNPFAKKDTSTKPGGFGHAMAEGKPVDVIEWGCKRMYYGVAPASSEQALSVAFRNFTQSFAQDPSIDHLLEQAHAQQVAREQASLSQAMNYAMASQRANMARQADISRTLSESSNIVMQGWENRMASQDRISHNWSEAIRGVDSYVTTDGRTVEHSVSSDHVYQNQYGDTVGVSGNGLDQETMNRLNLTELNKKQ